MKKSELIPKGEDSWGRPLWKSKASGGYYCAVDFDVDLDDILAGKAELYIKGPHAEGEPSHPVPLTDD